MSWVARLSDDEVAAITSEPRDGGGFQQLMGRLQDAIEGNELRVEDDIHDQMVRYSDEYGEGGWQERLELLSNVVYGGSGGVGLVFLFRLGVGSDSVAEFHAQDHVLQAV